MASRIGRVHPACRMASAVASAIWITGNDTAACTASAPMCIVFVQITSPSAPPASRRRAAAPRGAPPRRDEERDRARPIARVLPLRELGEVEGPHQELRRVQAAETL